MGPPPTTELNTPPGPRPALGPQQCREQWVPRRQRGPLGPKHQDQHDIRGGHDGDADPTGRWVRCTAWSPDGAAGWAGRAPASGRRGREVLLNLASATAIAENEDDPEPYYVLGLCWVDDATLAIGGGSHDGPSGSSRRRVEILLGVPRPRGFHQVPRGVQRRLHRVTTARCGSGTSLQHNPIL